MARPADDPPSENDEIDGRADALAKEFHADLPRTTTTLQRLIGELPFLQAQRADISRSQALGYAAGFLRAAFLALEPSDALTLLESTPLDVLEQKVWISNYLAGANDVGSVPLYSRQELAERLVAFREFLASDQQHLLKTGLPSNEFPDCP